MIKDKEIEKLRSDTLDQIQVFGQKLEQYEKLRRQKKPEAFSKAFSLIREYEILSRFLYTLRAKLSENDSFRCRIEEAVSYFQFQFGFLKPKETSKISFSLRYRKAWHTHLSLFFFTLIFFLLTMLLGWHITITNPTMASVIISQQSMEQILDKQRWFDSLAENPFLDGLWLSLHNIKVSLQCFVLGTLGGIGGVGLLAYNGVNFGSIFGFCYVHQFHEALLSFVVGHAPLELSIIVVSAFCGLLIGRVFFLRPWKFFSARMHFAASDAGTILAGSLPWLFLAGLIEAFISPGFQFSYHFKLGFGILAAAAYWTWTFFPTSSTTIESKFASLHKDE